MAKTNFNYLGGCGIMEARYTRITIITARLIALFLVPLYSAFVVSMILCPVLKLPFADIEGLIKDGSYKIAFPKLNDFDGLFTVNFKFFSLAQKTKKIISNFFKILYYRKELFFTNFFKDSTDPWSKIAYEKYLLEPMPESSAEIVEKICKVKKVAFLLEEEFINMIRCETVKIPKPLSTGWYAYQLRYNSPYEKIFNRM